MKHLLHLDLIGQKPEISIKQSSTYQTIFGTILSFFILFITVYSSKDLFDQYINKTYPQESINYIKNEETMNFNIENLPVLIQYKYFNPKNSQVNDVQISKLNDDHIYYPTTKFVDYDDNNDKIAISKIEEHLPKCNLTSISSFLKKMNKTNSTLFNIEREFWEEYYKKAKDSFCFNQLSKDHENFHIRRDDNTKGRYIFILFSSKISDYIKNIAGNPFILSFVSFSYPKYYLSASEKNKQYTKDLDIILFPIESTPNIYFYDIFFNSFDIISDYSEFFVENQKEAKYYTIDYYNFRGSINAELLDASNTDYNRLILILNMNKIKKIYKYKYLGITDIISNLGGSFQIYFILISFIHTLLSQFHYKAFLINSIFSFHYNNTVSRKETKNKFLRINSNSLPLRSMSLENKKTLVNDLVEDYIKSKEKTIITAKEIFYSSISSFFQPESVKNKIINKCSEVLDQQYEYSNIIRLLLENYIQNEMILNSSLQRFLHFPSINLSKGGYSLSLLNKVMMKRDDVQYDDVKMLLDKYKNQDKYLKLFKLFMETE